jgi:outer membrane protein assembly factor BamB
VKDELERVEIPGEAGAFQRGWPVLEAAFSQRQPVPRSSRWPRVAAVALALGAVLAGAVSTTPGQAVLDEIREVVGVEESEQALFALPADGKLLVSSDAGVWVVNEDGSRRRLGDYREASWSPFGRFVVAARANELAALEPDGDVRWSLAREGVTSPRWAGTETDTRVAYVDGTGLRVVAGDGTGDRLLARGFRGAIAWRPGDGFQLAVATGREVRLLDTTSGRVLWRRARGGAAPSEMAWSSDGRRLLVAGSRSVVVFDERGAVPYELGPGAAPVTSAALAPHGRTLVFASEVGGRTELWVVPRIRPDANAARRLFSGTGRFEEVAWSPDGSWVIVAWGAADQWVFVRANGAGIRAVSNISRQFRSQEFPRVEGWCCT